MELFFGLCFFVIAYLIGSINTSIIVSGFMGTDIRKEGSKNAGATNTLRTLGVKAAVYVLIGDALKTIIAILLVRFVFNGVFSKYALPDGVNEYLAGLGVIIGHNYPLYFGFKGGKGIVTSLTAALMITPLYGIICLVIGVVTIAISRYVSLGSVIGVISYAIISVVFEYKNIYFIVFAAVLAILAVYRHKTNIERILNHTESKLGSKKEG